MGEFFKGWRRKLGVVTLMVACVFAIGWARSFFLCDDIRIPVGNTFSGLVSASGEIDLYRCTGEPVSFYVQSTELSKMIGDWLDENRRLNPWSDTHTMEWKLEGLGFRAGVSRWANRRDEDYVIQYWLIAIPLTVISGYLLLSKPRKPAQKKLIEPVPAEGR